MNRKKFFIILVAVYIAFALFSFLGRFFEGEEGRVKRLILSAKRASEKEDLVYLSGILSYDYRDQYGNDRSTLLYLARNFFSEYKDIIIGIKELELELSDATAKARLKAMALAKRESSVGDEPKQAEYDIIEMTIAFTKEDGQWKVTALEFSEPNEIKFLRAT